MEITNLRFAGCGLQIRGVRKKFLSPIVWDDLLNIKIPTGADNVWNSSAIKIPFVKPLCLRGGRKDRPLRHEGHTKNSHPPFPKKIGQVKKKDTRTFSVQVSLNFQLGKAGVKPKTGFGYPVKRSDQMLLITAVSPFTFTSTMIFLPSPLSSTR